MVFVAEHFLLLALLARCLSTSKGMRREAPVGDREHLSALRAGHASMEGLLLAGCLVAEGEGVETGKALDLLHFISTAGAREAEVTSLQGNVRGFRGLRSLGHFEVRIRNSLYGSYGWISAGVLRMNMYV